MDSYINQFESLYLLTILPSLLKVLLHSTTGGHIASTICLGCSDPFHIVSYYIKRVTTYWTYSNIRTRLMQAIKFADPGFFRGSDSDPVFP